MNPKHHILLLGGSEDQLFIMRTAHEMGIGTVVIDGNPNAPGLKSATHSAPINFSDIPEVIEYVNHLRKDGVNVCGVTVMGSDVPHIVSAIAHEFNWIGPTKQTGKWATDKFSMKCRFAEEHVPVPNFSLVSSADDVLKYWRAWNCQRVIIKPTDRAGSRGVRVISGKDEAGPSYEYALSCSNNSQVILEEYIPGLQISTESILTDNRAATPGFADRVYEGMDAFWPQIMENGGWVPSILDTSTQAAVVELVERAARALGIHKGVAKGDVVIHPEKGPMMIEMAARLSGGDFSESLVPLGCGINYVKAALKIALGEEPDWNELTPKWNKTVANRYFFLPPGKLEGISGLDRVRKMHEIKKLNLSYKTGDLIPEISHHGQRVGVMVVVGQDRTHVQRIVDTVYDELIFKIEGQWLSGRPGIKHAKLDCLR